MVDSETVALDEWLIVEICVCVSVLYLFVMPLPLSGWWWLVVMFMFMFMLWRVVSDGFAGTITVREARIARHH